MVSDSYEQALREIHELATRRDGRAERREARIAELAAKALGLDESNAPRMSERDAFRDALEAGVDPETLLMIEDRRRAQAG